MFDHLYFEIDNIRLRIIGPFVKNGSVAFIPRLVLTEGAWIKPPVYATENSHLSLSAILAPFDQIDIAGRQFPTVRENNLRCPIDPYRWFLFDRVTDRSRELMTDLLRHIGLGTDCGLGLGGSRLLGSESPKSDVDVIFDEKAENIRSQVLNSLDQISVSEPYGHSERARRFVALYKGARPSLRERNIFGGSWRGLRVDLFSTFPQRLVTVSMSGSEGSEIRRQDRWSFRVIRDTDRMHYPIHITGVGLSDPHLKVSLFTFDPVMHYALDGDVVVVRDCSFATGDNGYCYGAFHDAVEIC